MRGRQVGGQVAARLEDRHIISLPPGQGNFVNKHAIKNSKQLMSISHTMPVGVAQERPVQSWADL